jgi:hypothetical protein
MPVRDWTKDMVTTPANRRLIAAIATILLTAAAGAGWRLTARVLPSSSPSQTGAERNLAMSDHPAKPIAPMHGPKNAAPWPVPLPPDASVMTFSGNGDATTQEFELPSDGALRIAVEKGPMVLRVLRSDGTEGATLSPIPTAGLALGAIPQAGTYTLEVQTSGRWAVTVVFGTNK